ncbi:cytochrome c oxidase subunit II [Conexibacter sp. DBS9H8]|uniref:cytochrome c oxidase subunit II n=1 Tax=Conexibacter sp. DBS9H8 TaxID=2937801 RepID=UPI00200C6CA8|nr:cytochrome c oxidase subunit II [Conexibacter sp. DBS9H8]
MPVPTAIVDTRHVYDWVFGIYVPIGIGVFGFFTVTIIVVTVRFRRRDGRRHRLAGHNEANRLELAYAVVLLCIAAVLLDVTFRAEHLVDTASARERPALTVDVIASRWEWTFRYAGHGITHVSGAVGDAPLVVPVDEPVRFNLTSRDVIHGFWIPQLAFKRDAMPGTVERVTLDFDRTGSFSGACSEYCGIFHSEMVFGVRVLPDRRFDRWLARHGAGPV